MYSLIFTPLETIVAGHDVIDAVLEVMDTITVSFPKRRKLCAVAWVYTTANLPIAEAKAIVESFYDDEAEAFKLPATWAE